MEILWYHWAILGVALVLAELAVPAFVLVWFGLGALVVSLLVALWSDSGFVLQLLVWIAVSLSLGLLWFKVVKPRQHKIAVAHNPAEAVGEVGLLISEIEPLQRSRVRFQTPVLGANVWECVADEKISAGERVRVVSVEDGFLKISKEKTA